MWSVGILIVALGLMRGCCTQSFCRSPEMGKKIRQPSDNVPTLNVAMYQCASVFGNKEANLKQMSKVAQEAASKGIQLLIFPELYLIGYTEFNQSEFATLPEPLNGPSLQIVQKIAQMNNISISYGFVEVDQGDLFDTDVLVDNNGEMILSYRKTHLWEEESYYLTPGKQLGPVVNLHGVKVGFLTCFDVWFPETTRVLSLQDADFIIIPTANGYPPNINIISNTIVPARAAENDVYVAYINYAQTNGMFAWYGLSTFADPGGNIIVQGNSEDTQMLVGLVKGRSQPNPIFKQRKPQLYGMVCQTNLTQCL